jgi:hypothetical protein
MFDAHRVNRRPHYSALDITEMPLHPTNPGNPLSLAVITIFIRLYSVRYSDTRSIPIRWISAVSAIAKSDSHSWVHDTQRLHLSKPDQPSILSSGSICMGYLCTAR